MKVFAAVLIMLSAMKLFFVLSLSKKDIQEFNMSFSSKIDNLGEQLVKLVTLDGLVGICCGLYIFFL